MLFGFLVYLLTCPTALVISRLDTIAANIKETTDCLSGYLTSASVLDLDRYTLQSARVEITYPLSILNWLIICWI